MDVYLKALTDDYNKINTKSLRDARDVSKLLKEIGIVGKRSTGNKLRYKIAYEELYEIFQQKNFVDDKDEYEDDMQEPKDDADELLRKAHQKNKELKKQLEEKDEKIKELERKIQELQNNSEEEEVETKTVKRKKRLQKITSLDDAKFLKTLF